VLEHCCDIINQVFRAKDVRKPREVSRMAEADRIFLKDFQNLTFKNHIMAVQALRHGGAKAKEFAVLYLKHEDPTLTTEQAIALEAEINERARFQRVMFAKMFAEYVAAMEDFGALCHAIRHRGAEGVLSHYLSSSPAQVGTLFDHVLTHPQEDLATLFKLPDLPSLQSRMTSSVFGILSNHYAETPKHIAEVANKYRMVGEEHIDGLASLSSGWEERVHIMVAAPGARQPEATGGVAVLVLNKIKHRFMLIESVEEYAKLPNAELYRAVGIGTAWHHVGPLIESLRTVSMGTAEIAATIRVLDEAGIAI
jgi:hypothetical protein